MAASRSVNDSYKSLTSPRVSAFYQGRGERALRTRAGDFLPPRGFMRQPKPPAGVASLMLSLDTMLTTLRKQLARGRHQGRKTE